VDPSNTPCELSSLEPPFCSQPWQKVVANVGNAGSKGFELQLDAAVNQNMTVGFGASFLDAALSQDVQLEPGFVLPSGSRLPLSPEFKAYASVAYEKPVDWMDGKANSAYFRVQYSHTGDMFNQVEPTGPPHEQILQPSYDLMDLSVGVRGDDWALAFFVDNLTDKRAVLFDNPYEFDHFFGLGRQTVNRPREIGIRFSKSFTR
jgi:outer membrane receptor protein involved in Fe transport